MKAQGLASEDVIFYLSLAEAVSQDDKLQNTLKLLKREEDFHYEHSKARVERLVEMMREKCDYILETMGPDAKPEGIYVDGVFDLMHVGHYNALRQAKNLGDFIVTGAIADETIQKVKGPTVMNVHERLEILSHCKYVDKIVEQKPYQVPLEDMDKWECQNYAHGDDPRIDADGSDALARYKDANRLKIFKRTEGVSTTDMTGRILSLGKYQQLLMENPQHAAEFLESKYKEPPKQKFLATSKRILNFSEGKMPQPNDTIIYVQGSFDLLHYGHLKRLEEAKKLGTFLYVGLWDDDLTRHYKGSLYPLVSLQERVLMMLACKHVDDVIIGAPYVITKDLIKSLNIHKVVTIRNCQEDPVIPEEQDVDPYKIPRELDILQEITITDPHYNMTTEKLALRVFQNKNNFEKKFARKAKEEEKYYDNKQTQLVES